MTSAPQNLPPDLAALWLSAAYDGWLCGSTGGYQEQNPYTLDEPLFDAWRTGWFDGIDDMPAEVRDRPVPSTLPSILNAAWKDILQRTTLTIR